MSFRLPCLALLLLLPAHGEPLPARAPSEARTSQPGVPANISRGYLLPGLVLPGQPAAKPATNTRTRLLHLLAIPDVAVLLLGIGALLIFAECNLPGAILPGASGLLLLLSGIFALTLLPTRPAALLLLFAASLSLAFSAKIPAFGLPALLGTAGLVYSFATLITSPASTAPAVHPLVAITVGVVGGMAASLLGRIAYLARQNKRVLLSGKQLAGNEIPGTGPSDSGIDVAQAPAAPNQSFP